MKRTFAMMLCLATAACGSKSNGSGAGGTSYSGTDPRFIGRVQSNTDGGTLMSWSGTGAETRFNGSQLTINMQAAQTGQANRVSVLVDGAVAQTFFLQDGQTSYQVNVSAGDHEARVVKLSEAGDGQIVFTGFSSNGKSDSEATLTPPTRSIEFIGDSITAGFGDEVNNTNPSDPNLCPADPTNMPSDPNFQNVLKAYGPLAANTLNADYSVIAWSGKGVYENRNAQDAETMPKLWPLVNPLDTTSAYDFKAQPDVVVVDLCTNDFSAMSQGSTAAIPASDQAPFTDAYVSFLQSIRAKYPKAYIVVALGPMLSHYYPTVQDQLALAETWVKGVVTQANDPKISFFEFTANSTAYGCDDHPGTSVQQSMSAALATQIQSLTGWK